MLNSFDIGPAGARVIAESTANAYAHVWGEGMAELLASMLAPALQEDTLFWYDRADDSVKDSVTGMTMITPHGRIEITVITE